MVRHGIVGGWWCALFVAFALVGTISMQSRACESLLPWSRLSGSAEHFVAPLPLALVAGSFATPLVFAPTGADYQLRLFAQRDLHGRPNAEPISVWTPYVLAAVVGSVDSVALMTDRCETARPPSAMLQAMGVSLAAVTSLKWIAGRSWPSGGLDPNAPDYLRHPEFARRFNWFSWNQGTAWPSGHTAIMAAAASSLSTVQFGRSWLGYAAYAATAGVAAGMWLGDHHWASDIISGGLLGAAIGQSVGLSFREEANGSAEKWLILPFVTGTSSGLEAMADW